MKTAAFIMKDEQRKRLEPLVNQMIFDERGNTRQAIIMQPNLKLNTVDAMLLTVEQVEAIRVILNNTDGGFQND